ncbi:MAG TPA: hypothetical protein VKV24_03555 [Casimicrobiaceae bacterium]|nr:hypothetical protein [Casimicrobiaceae bacterium]
MKRLHRLLIAVTAICVCSLPMRTSAHGFAGDRFFPATILTDDPFVADEMSLPTLTFNPKASDDSKETDVGFDLAKRLTPNLGLTLSEQWIQIRAPDQPTAKGFDALDVGVQYQLFVDGPHQAMGLIGLDTTWAHTGARSVANPDYTTLSPTFDFGKGFGDLPAALTWLRPLAITGNLSVDFPTKAQSEGSPNPNMFNVGLAFEYSLEYLQHHVKDVGLRAPFDRMIPLVEVAVSTPFNRGQSGQSTGTVQPGVIWAGQYFQVGAEAIIPINSRTGHGVGAVVQLHFFLDDLFPHTIGKPLFGD